MNCFKYDGTGEGTGFDFAKIRAERSKMLKEIAEKISGMASSFDAPINLRVSVIQRDTDSFFIVDIKELSALFTGMAEKNIDVVKVEFASTSPPLFVSAKKRQKLRLLHSNGTDRYFSEIVITESGEADLLALTKDLNQVVEF